jgi:hypothetical protein
MKHIAKPEIELEIIQLGYDLFNLDLDEFWYKWFDSNNPFNKTIHLMVNKKLNENLLRKYLFKFKTIEIEKIFKITLVDNQHFRECEGFNYMYDIHFKIK